MSLKSVVGIIRHALRFCALREQSVAENPLSAPDRSLLPYVCCPTTCTVCFPRTVAGSANRSEATTSATAQWWTCLLTSFPGGRCAIIQATERARECSTNNQTFADVTSPTNDKMAEVTFSADVKDGVANYDCVPRVIRRGTTENWRPDNAGKSKLYGWKCGKTFPGELAWTASVI